MEKILDIMIDVGGVPQHFPSNVNPAQLTVFSFESVRMGAAPEIKGELKWPTCLDNLWTDDVYVIFNGERYNLYHRPTSEKDTEDERFKHTLTFRNNRSILAGVYVYDAVTGENPSSNNTTVVFAGKLENSRDGQLREIQNGFVAKLNASLQVSGLSQTFVVTAEAGIETVDATISFEDKYFTEALSEAVETWGVPYYIYKETDSSSPNYNKTVICFGHNRTVIGSENSPLTYRTRGLTMTKREHSGNDVINRATGYGSSQNLPWFYPNESSTGVHTFGGNLYVEGDTKVNVNRLADILPGFATTQETLKWYRGYPYRMRPSFCEIFFRDADFAETYYDVPVRAIYAHWPENAYDEQHGTPGYYPILENNESSIAHTDYIARQFGSFYDCYSTTGFFFYLEQGQTIHMAPNFEMRLQTVTLTPDSNPQSKHSKVVKISNSPDAIGDQVYNYLLSTRGPMGPVPGHNENGELIENEFILSYLTDGTDLVEDNGTFTFTAPENGLYLFEFRRRYPITSAVPTAARNVGAFALNLNRDLYFDIDGPHFRREGFDNEFFYANNGIIKLSNSVVPADGDTLTISQTNWDTWMTPQPNLIPSIYRNSRAEKRFYNARNYPYTPAAGELPDTDAGEYVGQDGKFYNDLFISESNNNDHYVFDFLYNKNLPGRTVEHIGHYDEIEATIAGIVNSLDQPIDQFLAIAYDEYDNNHLIEDTQGNSQKLEHPYFYVKLPKMPFNLFDCVGTSPAVISMVTGMCSSCKFEIKVQENSNRNTVRVDEQGNLVRDENGNVRLDGDQDRQNNTMEYEVWIALEKDTSTYGISTPMPYAVQVQGDAMQPSTDDKYVITGIEMPFEYILAAEERLSKRIVSDIYDNNFHKFNIGIDFSRIFLEENSNNEAEYGNVLSSLCDAAKIWVRHDSAGNAVELYVSSFRYSVDEDALPEISVEVADTLNPSPSPIRLLEANITKNILSKTNSNVKPVLSAELDSTAQEPIILNTSKKRSSILRSTLLDNLGFQPAGSLTRPIFLNSLREFKEIDGLNLPEDIYTEKNIQAGGGVSARGIVDLNTYRSGGQGTLTEIRIAGVTIPDTNGVVNIPLATTAEGGNGAMSYLDKTKLNEIEEYAQVNVLESVKVNGTPLTITNKAVNIPVPTALSQLTDDATHRLVTDTQITAWTGKQDAISDLSTIRTQAGEGHTAYGYFDGGILPIGAGGTGASSASAARTNLGLGSAATKNTGTTDGTIPVLGLSGKLPLSTIPDVILGQVLYAGTVNGTGVTSLSDNAKTKWGITSLTLTSSNYSTYQGAYFIASADGTSGVPSALGVKVGDWVIATADGWQKIDNTDAVTGVKGDAETNYRIGNINITKANIGLGNVENTKLSTWSGTTNITTLGTIATGVWHGTAIADTYISSASTWNAKYQKPANGIPLTDLESGVQTSLGYADTVITYFDANGVANSAAALTTNAGTSSTPVYFANGVPVACGFSVLTNVPSGAVFTDTKNTAGTTDNASKKLYLVGALSQAANPQTYSNVNAYIGTDNHLYSNGVQVVNLSASQALTNKTYNGLTLTAASTGFTISGGTTSKTLTVTKTVTLGDAAGYGVIDRQTAIAINNSGTSLMTERAVYNGLPNINGAHNYTSNTNIFAPTTAGTAGYTLVSAGSGAPGWTDVLSIDTVNRKVNVGTAANPADLQSFGGVAARGIVDLNTFGGGGGSGTLTQIQINGTVIQDVNGVVNLPLATTSAAGTMSASDKSKLNGIEAGANNYSLPIASASSLGGIKVGSRLSIDENGVLSATYTYSLPLAANGTRGGVQIGFSESNSGSATNRNYAVKLSSEKMYVNVPWENTHNSHALTVTNGTASAVSQGTEITYVESVTGCNATSGNLTASTTRKKITVPSVSNATITIKQTGISDQTFTLNGSATTITLADTNTWRPLGTGASDACAGNDSRLSNARPASDVYAWAKAATRPTYNTSIAASSGTAAVTLNFGSKYQLSAGDTNCIFALASLPAATTSAAGIAQLSSAVDSTSEVLAATPKAVKTAYDLAAGKALKALLTTIVLSGESSYTMSQADDSTYTLVTYPSSSSITAVTLTQGGSSIPAASCSRIHYICFKNEKSSAITLALVKRNNNNYHVIAPSKTITIPANGTIELSYIHIQVSSARYTIVTVGDVMAEIS